MNWIATWLLIGVSLAGTVKDQRYGNSAACTLVADDTAPCSFVSTLGVDDVRSALVSVRLGENNCTVALKGCVPGECYVVADLAQTAYPTDPHAPRPQSGSSSVFRSVAVEGAASVAVTKRGVEFVAGLAGEMTFHYSTVGCAEFYSYRGRVSVQRCDQPQVLQALSKPTPGHGPFRGCSST